MDVYVHAFVSASARMRACVRVCLGIVTSFLFPLVYSCNFEPVGRYVAVAAVCNFIGLRRISRP